MYCFFCRKFPRNTRRKCTCEKDLDRLPCFSKSSPEKLRLQCCSHNSPCRQWILYILVVKRTFAIRFATCSWIVATSWLISGAFPPLMQACPLPPQMFLQFRGGDCLNDSHMCPQHDCFPVFPSKKNSERRKGLFHRCIFFCCFSKICVQKKQGYTFLSVACHLA